MQRLQELLSDFSLGKTDITTLNKGKSLEYICISKYTE